MCLYIRKKHEKSERYPHRNAYREEGRGKRGKRAASLTSSNQTRPIPKGSTFSKPVSKHTSSYLSANLIGTETQHTAEEDHKKRSETQTSHRTACSSFRGHFHFSIAHRNQTPLKIRHTASSRVFRGRKREIFKRMRS